MPSHLSLEAFQTQNSSTISSTPRKNPADLPGGGTGGIGQVRDTDPPTVNLALGGPGVRAGQGLGVGDTFAVAGTTYEITCVSAAVVTADRVSS